jgi:hypothetical protein
MPDTHYANLQQRSAAPPNACAMISYSLGHRAELFFVFRDARRSTPMMAADRSTLSCRAILYLLVLLGTPVVVHSDTLDDSAKELASKIAAVLTTRGEMSCDIRNVSSLELDDVVRIGETLKTELQGQCVRTQENGSETANIVVTLSENVKSYLWTAEIHQGAGYREILQVVPRLAETQSSAKALPIVLKSERFWAGPERILDAGLVSAPNGDQLLVLLHPDDVVLRNVNTGSENLIGVSLAIPIATLREPSGALSLQVGNLIAAQHDRRNCTVSLVTFALIKCEDYLGEMMSFGGLLVKGGQVVSVSTQCTKGSGISSFVTGTGDDTQPDFLQVEVSQNLGSAIASNQVSFPGPIMAIHGALTDAFNTVIARNLNTKNYEAYHLSISCAQ